MRTLLLLRHAKSSWDDPAVDDIDRPLAPRGLKAAPLMGQAMQRHGWLPDLALVSPARRTRQTWDLMRAELGRDVRSAFLEGIYAASADTLSDLVAAASTVDASTVLLVGHNPGLEELAARLAGKGSSRDAAQRMAHKFPTGALARFRLRGPWDEIGRSQSRLTHFLVPRDLASGGS